MAWFRYSDDWNRKPEIRALDDATYRAFQCLIEAAEAFDRCGTVTDDYAMGTYPHVRRKLRGRVRDLDDRGLVHLLDSADDYHPDCPSCLVRRTEVGTEAGQKHPLSASTSARSGRTEALLICIRSFFDVAMTPERKREKRQKDAERQQRKRDRDKADPSRRDAEPPSRPPVPVPVPKLKINDHVPLAEETEPSSTASPSTPSNGTADRDAVSWLRSEWTRRQQKRLKPARWKPDYQPHLDSIVRKASDANGDTFAILTAALEAFFSDSEQQGFGCIPKGLDWKWDQFAGPYLEQIESEARARRIADKDAKYQRDLEAEGKKRLQQALERNPEWQQEGCTPGNSGTPMADAVAELMQSISGGKV